MTTYEEILAYCERTHPAVVYIGIGCAANPAQQNPPFLNKYWPDANKVLVLIDPALDDLYVADTPQCRIFDMRAMFHWPSVWNVEVSLPHITFLAALFTFASASPRTQVVIQDYTGEDIREYFTRPAPDFDHRRILFDATYAAGGCLPDLDAVCILRAPNGDFLQPAWLPLRTTYLHMTQNALAVEMRERADVLVTYAHRYYHVMQGTKQSRAWCSADIVSARVCRLMHAYGIMEGPLYADKLRALLAEGLRDFSVIAGRHLTRQEIYAALDNPEYEYRKLLETLMTSTIADKTSRHE